MSKKKHILNLLQNTNFTQLSIMLEGTMSKF